MMAQSSTCEERNTPGLHILYKTAKVNGDNWQTWLYCSCCTFAQEMILCIQGDDECSDIQCQETVDQLWIIICESSRALFWSDQSSWDMHKHVQSQTFKTIRTSLNNVIVKVRDAAEKNNCCVIYHYYCALHQVWYVMNYLETFAGTSLKSLTRRHICQELWTREEIDCLPKTEVPEMLKKELLDYWQNVKCPPAPLSRQPEPCDCVCGEDAAHITCSCNMCLSH